MSETACCEAVYGLDPDTMETCGRPGATYATVGCVHEHIDELYICTVCERRGTYCADCYDHGHNCLMLVVRAPVKVGRRGEIAGRWTQKHEQEATG